MEECTEECVDIGDPLQVSVGDFLDSALWDSRKLGPFSKAFGRVVA